VHIDVSVFEWCVFAVCVYVCVYSSTLVL